jgi:hypothetical protein
MIQVVENHRLITEQGFAAGLSHSIGGPINNNVVILLERSSHYEQRRHEPYKPWGLPSLSATKPKEVSVETLLAGNAQVEGSFVTATTRFDHQSGAPLNTIMVVACRMQGHRYSFLFGLGGEAYEDIALLRTDDRVTLERADEAILVNRMPVKRFYQKTIEGMADLAGVGWRLLRGRG